MTISVWKLDDCDYVAAESQQEAVAWYTNLTGVEVEDVEAANLNMKGHTGEGPDDPDSEFISFAEMIRRAQEAGQEFPMILGTDPHYA